MTLKAFAYSIQAHLKSSAALSVRRSHIYELLAAAYGFGTYAALCDKHVFTEWPSDLVPPQPDPMGIRLRSQQLGLDGERIALALEPLLRAVKLGPVSISTAAALILDHDTDESPSILLDGLHAAADRGKGAAHRALAALYGKAWEAEGSAYWHARQQAGHPLTGVEAQWADNEGRRLARVARHTHHLKEAARLNHGDALLELAERFGDPAFFDKRCRETGRDPAEVADIAETLGRDADAYYWYTVAAMQGDVGAMERLIEVYDRDNPQQRWTWIYLAGHLGTDFLEDDFQAIHDDGSLYDDDVGGPLHVVGRAAIDIPPLDAKSDRLAREAAEALLATIPLTDESGEPDPDDHTEIDSDR